MNQLMETRIENDRKFLTYKYKKVQDVDDVILQLLNEADIEGFVKSFLNKATSTVNYDVTEYKGWSEVYADNLTPESAASMLENLYQLLAYLEDSFIDIEYVLLDKAYIYVHPETGHLQLIVVPCQAVADEEFSLTDCVGQLLEQFTYGENECANELKNILGQGIRSLEALNEMADILRTADSTDFADESEATETTHENDVTDVLNETEVSAETEDASEDEDAVELSEEDPMQEGVSEAETEENTEEIGAEEKAILDAIADEAGQIKTESANIMADAEYMRRQLREDMRKELKEELTEQLRQEVTADVRRELENELRAQIREETRKELEAELRESIRAEIEAEQAAEPENEKMSYLIRKKTGEIISLNKQTFIIGKLDTCCDYVIRGNKAISRLHAVIKYKEDTDSYVIVDCNSTNHIYLNGRQIEAEQPEVLTDGMHIHLALEEFVFQLR